jgi:hypothetical protein
MRRLMLMTVGGAVGYVLGARAGRPAYDRMVARARRMAESTGLSQAAETMTSAAQDLGDAGLQRANATVAPMGRQAADAMGQVSDRLRDNGATAGRDGIDVTDGTVWTKAGSGLED